MPSLYSLLAIAVVAFGVAANPVGVEGDVGDIHAGDISARDIDFALPEADLDSRSLEERTTCTVKSGVAGTCISTSACASQNKFSEAGHCPGAANIQCCYTPKCSVGGIEGSCITTSACAAQKLTHAAGYCPGPSNIQCCYKPGAPSSGSCAAKIVSAAESQKGVPYVYGGGSCTGKTGGGFDCSGLVRYSVYQAKKVCLVHSAQSQYLDTTHGKRIPLASRQPGDVVFWTTGSSCSSGVEHTAIVKNANTLVVARHTGTLVQEQAFWTKSGDLTICPYAMRYC